jgi:hypothetical protein
VEFRNCHHPQTIDKRRDKKMLLDATHPLWFSSECAKVTLPADTALPATSFAPNSN